MSGFDSEKCGIVPFFKTIFVTNINICNKNSNTHLSSDKVYFFLNLLWLVVRSWIIISLIRMLASTWLLIRYLFKTILILINISRFIFHFFCEKTEINNYIFSKPITHSQIDKIWKISVLKRGCNMNKRLSWGHHWGNHRDK